MPQPDSPEIHSRLEEIFSRPEFGSGGAAPIDWMELIFRWLADWLNSLEGAGPAVYWLVIGVCLALLGLLAGYIAWSVRRMMFISSRPAGKEKSHEKRRRLSSAYREEALRQAAAGEFTEAIRFLFLSLVYRFDENGRVNFHRAYTNREYLTLFADRRSLYTDLKSFVDLLDEYWYGERPSTREQFAQCETRYELLIGQA